MLSDDGKLALIVLSLDPDVTKGDNSLFGAPCCKAGEGFNMAAGWGSVDFSGFATAASAAAHR